MSDWAADKALKKAMKVIASEFSNYFSGLTVKQEGLRPHPDSIAIQSIEIKNMIGRGRQLHLVEVNYHSDVGLGHSGRLFIKVFNTYGKLDEEANGAIFLQKILEKNSYIKTPKLLYTSQDYNILVYEGLYAEELDKYENLEEADKLFLAGSVLPAIHANVLKEVDLQRYYLILEKTIEKLIEIDKKMNLDMNEQLKNIRQLMVLEIENYMFHSHGGARVFGDFHAGNIMISNRELRPNNKLNDYQQLENNLYQNLQIYIIDPEFLDPESDQVDRFEDIASFFIKDILDEFIESNFKALDKSKTNINQFLKGYNEQFQKMTNGLNLRDLYPKGITLDFQICMAVLFDLLFFIRNSNQEMINVGINVRLKLIEALLRDQLLNMT